MGILGPVESDFASLTLRTFAVDEVKYDGLRRAPFMTWQLHPRFVIFAPTFVDRIEAEI